MGPAAILLKVLEPRGPAGGPAGDVLEGIHGKGFCWGSWSCSMVCSLTVQQATFRSTELQTFKETFKISN